MSVEVKKEIELEIAYVLFIDIVGYSKLVTHEQRRLLELLNQIVREAEHFRAAEAKSRLITVPTGDGMALVFYNTPEAPVECALEISRAASEHPELKLRMGITWWTGQWRSGRKWSLKHCGSWNQYRAARDGLRRRWPHSHFETPGRGRGTVRPLEATSARPGRMRGETRSPRLGGQSLYRGRGQSRGAAEGSRSAAPSGGSGRRETGLEQKLDCRGCAHNSVCLGRITIVAALCLNPQWRDDRAGTRCFHSSFYSGKKHRGASL